MTNVKPLNFTPDPALGFTAERRTDGGITVVFKNVNRVTLEAWRNFAEDHLLGSDRLVRNLYDLRAVEHIPDEAIQIAVELDSDPSARNIRLAVVVANDETRAAIQKIRDLAIGGGARMGIFTDMAEAEAWLSRPIASMV